MIGALHPQAVRGRFQQADDNEKSRRRAETEREYVRLRDQGFAMPKFGTTDLEELVATRLGFRTIARFDQARYTAHQAQLALQVIRDEDAPQMLPNIAPNPEEIADPNAPQQAQPHPAPYLVTHSSPYEMFVRLCITLICRGDPPMMKPAGLNDKLMFSTDYISYQAVELDEFNLSGTFWREPGAVPADYRYCHQVQQIVIHCYLRLRDHYGFDTRIRAIGNTATGIYKAARIFKKTQYTANFYRMDPNEYDELIMKRGLILRNKVHKAMLDHYKYFAQHAATMPADRRPHLGMNEYEVEFKELIKICYTIFPTDVPPLAADYELLQNYAGRLNIELRPDLVAICGELLYSRVISEAHLEQSGMDNDFQARVLQAATLQEEQFGPSTLRIENYLPEPAPIVVSYLTKGPSSKRKRSAPTTRSSSASWSTAYERRALTIARKHLVVKPLFPFSNLT